MYCVYFLHIVACVCVCERRMGYAGCGKDAKGGWFKGKGKFEDDFKGKGKFDDDAKGKGKFDGKKGFDDWKGKKGFDCYIEGKSDGMSWKGKKGFAADLHERLNWCLNCSSFPLDLGRESTAGEGSIEISWTFKRGSS